MSEYIAPAITDHHYRLLVESIQDYAIFMLDESGKILSWNLGAEKIKGYTAQEIIGQNFRIFYTQSDRDQSHPELELEKAKAEGCYEEEGWRLRKNGDLFWARITITRRIDLSGHFVGFSKITRDLSERLKVEKSLRDSEERFRLVVEGVKDYAIIVLDPQGYIMSWNEGARRLKGYAEEEILSHHFSIFYEPEDVQVGKCEYELKEASITGRFEDEGWRVRKDGTRFWANVVITALYDSKRNLRGFVKITRDITERRRADERLKMAYDSLEIRVAERTQELHAAVKARDEFISIASHELRTPLTSLHLQQQIIDLRNESFPGKGLTYEEAIEMANLNRRQIENLIQLVEDMLDVTRIDAKELEYDKGIFNLSDLLVEIGSRFAEISSQSGNAFDYKITPGIQFLGDKKKIEQVILKLLSNALKFGEGKPICLSLIRSSPSIIEISVHDEGPGIAAENEKRIFEKFVRLLPSDQVGGLGVGLFIAKAIVEGHGGRILLNSTAGEGAEFKVLLQTKAIKPSQTTAGH